MDEDVERTRRVRDELTSDKLDGVICQSSAHVLMLTGYAPVLGQSFAVVPNVGEPALIVPEGEDTIAREGWCTDIRVIRTSGINYETSYLNLVEPILATVLNERGLSKGRLGFEGSDVFVPASYTEVGYPSASSFHAMRRAAPDAFFTDASPLLSLLASRLTPREIAKLQIAGAAAAVGFHAARGQIHRGATESLIATAVESAVDIASSQTGAARIRGFAHVMSGSRSALAYLPFNLTENRVLKYGDPVLVQLEVYLDGFWIQASRTFFVGDPGAEGRRIYEATREAQALALDTIKDGSSAASADDAARSYVAGDGFGPCFLHGLGHGVGFSAICRNQPPRLAADSTDSLRTDMAVCVEPGIYVHGWGGVRIGDTATVRDGSADILTRAPRDLTWAIVPQRARM